MVDAMLIDTEKFNLREDEEERYEKLVGKPGNWRKKRDDQIAFLSELGLKPSDRLLDLGCGALRVGAPLIAYLDTGNYAGVDVDSECVAASKELVDRFDLRARRPTLVRSDSFGKDELEPQSFDRIWAFQVLIHLEEHLLHQAFAAMVTLLDPNGKSWVTVRVHDGDGFQVTGRWKRFFPINAASLSYYEDLASRNSMRFSLIRPISRIAPEGEKARPVYYLAEISPESGE